VREATLTFLALQIMKGHLSKANYINITWIRLNFETGMLCLFLFPFALKMLVTSPRLMLLEFVDDHVL
jgi:hypothetical protein